MAAPRDTAVIMLSWLATAAIVFVGYRLFPDVSSERSRWLIAAGAFFVAALVISFAFRPRTWLPLLLMLAGVAIGVLANVFYAQLAGGPDRNLFPFEVLAWWALSAIPLMAGYSLGKWANQALQHDKP
jgi:hypothetical protein